METLFFLLKYLHFNPIFHLYAIFDYKLYLKDNYKNKIRYGRWAIAYQSECFLTES